MKRLILLACVIAVGLSADCTSQSKPKLIESVKTLTNNEQLHEWLTYYYVHPRPDLVLSGVRLMTAHGWLSEPRSRPALAAFLAEILRQNTQSVGIWVSDLTTGPEDQKEFVAMAIWMEQSSDSDRLLKSIADGRFPALKQYVSTSLRGQPAKLLEDEITTPGFLDQLWGSFLASGDPRYVQRVISALPFLLAHDDPQRVTIGGAAKWSLTSNAAQHPKVLEICLAELGRLPDREKGTLEEVIQNAQKGDN